MKNQIYQKMKMFVIVSICRASNPQIEQEVE